MSWLMLPDPIFSDIMMMVGLESLESLHRCRQVCSKWNEMILRDIWENPNKKRIMKERIERSWGPGTLPTDEEISHAKWLEARAILDTDKIERLAERIKHVTMRDNTSSRISEVKCGASLAHYGLLGWAGIVLRDVNLSPVPVQHLASLVSCVTHSLNINNVIGCDLVSIFTSVKCRHLYITRQSLGREETQALVQAMESRVEQVNMCDVDLSPIPAQHLASLVSCVNKVLTMSVTINNVSGCGLVCMLSYVKCYYLYIVGSQSLGREETQALVQAMQSGVMKVRLWSEATLDIEALTEYSGQGVCREVGLRNDTMSRYREEMRTWARTRNWRVEKDNNTRLKIKSE